MGERRGEGKGSGGGDVRREGSGVRIHCRTIYCRSPGSHPVHVHTYILALLLLVVCLIS